jgi:O-antigen ligase
MFEKIIKKEYKKYSVLTIFFLTPLYLLRMKFAGLPTNLWEISAVLFFLFWFFSEKNKKDQLFKFREKFGKGPLLGAIFVLSGFILSGCLNYDCEKSFGIIKSWLVAPLLFSIAACSVFPAEQKKRLFSIYYLSALATAAISFFYLLSDHLTYDGRLSGFFNSPNYLAMYLAPAIIIGFFDFFQENFLADPNIKKNHRTWRGFSLLFMTIIFYLTYSHAAWLATAGAILIILIRIKKYLFQKIFLKILAAIFFISFLFFQSPETIPLQNLESQSSLSSRVMIWKSALKILSDNWLLGIGAGNFQNKYLEYQKYFPPYFEWAAPHPHNIFLAFWLYGGILSFGGFLILIGSFLKNFAVSKNQKGREIIAAGIIFYFLIHGLADTTYFKNDLAVIFWIFYWLSFSENHKLKR